MPNYASSVVRDLGDKLGELPSLRDFAAVGDGSTDDTSAVQTAVNSVSSRGGGRLLADPGTYKLTGPITIPSNVTICGYGETSLFQLTGSLASGTGWFDFGGSDSGLYNITIDGGVTTPVGILYSDFSGDPMHADLSDNTTLWFHGGAERPRIEKVTIRHSGGYAMLFDADEDNILDPTVVLCTLANNRPHSFGTATGTTSDGAWTGGIFIRGDCRTSEAKEFAVKNIRVEGCTFRRNLGNCLWMHSRGFDAHHTNPIFHGNSFEDCGLDAILVGNAEGGSTENNNIRRVGYITLTDNDAPAPRWPGYTYAVGIDSSGYVNNHNVKGNTLDSVNGGFIDLDGFRKGIVDGNTLSIPTSGTPQYTEDSIASFGTAGAVLSKGINGGNTQLNGGSEQVQVTNNTIRGCRTAAISMNYAKGWQVQGNTIDHPADALECPILIYAVDGLGTEAYAYDNSVLHNKISYAGPNFCIAEIGDAAAYGSATATNTIFNNQIYGTNSGEFLANGSSASICGCLFSSNDSTLGGPVASFVQQVGTGASAALQFYSISGTTKTYLAQFGHTGAVLNVGGTAGTGKVMTGTRVSAGTGGDMVFSGKLIGDSFLMLGDTTYDAAEANQFDEAYGLLRYVEGTTGTGTFLLSKSTNTAGRVWEELTFGSSTAPGNDTEVIFKDGVAFGAVPSFTYNKVTNVLTLKAGATATYGDAILRVLRADDSPSSMFEWSGNIITTNAAFISQDAGGLARSSMDGNPIPPYGLRMSNDAGVYWASTTYAFDTPDTGLQRAGARVLEITNAGTGTASGYGDLRLRNLAAFGTAADSVQSLGGFTGITFISTRTDGDGGLVLSTPSRAYDLRVASGPFQIYDRTAAASRFAIATNGQASIAGVAGQAALTLTAGYLLTSEGVVSTNTAFNTFQASLGGLYTKWATLDEAVYLKTLGTGASPTNPGGGYGGLGHRSGATYWYWNGAAWASIDFSAAGGSVPGANTQVIYNNGTAIVGSNKFTWDNTPAVLTIAGTAATAGLNVTGGYIQSAQGFYSTGAASTTVNIPSGGVTALSLISVRNDGGDGLTLSRTSSTARDWSQSVNSSGSWVLRDVSGGADRLTFTTAGALSLIGNISISGTSTSSGGAIAPVFNATNSSTSITFQNSNSNFSVNGNGDVSAAGSFNSTNANPYKVGGTPVITSGRAATFVSLTCTGGHVVIPAAYTYAVDSGSGFYYGQDATTGLVCGSRTLYFKSGILYAYV